MDKEAAKVTLETLFGRIDSLIAKDGKASKAELSKVFGEHADQFLQFCDKDGDSDLTCEEFCAGILTDAADMSQEDFDANWADRMEGVVAAAEGAQAGEAAPAAALKNKAFLFIKPHSVTEATKTLVNEALIAKGFAVLAEGAIS